MRIVVTTRTFPNSRFNHVQLSALDLPETRTYVLHHRNGGENLAVADALDVLHRKSAGLPPHLDRLLEALKYVNLNELADSDFGDGSEPAASEAIPRALERAVNGLARSESKYSRRSFKLLKLLTVLAEGETLQRLRHFDQSEPFFPENAAELEALQLLQTVPLVEVNPISTQDDLASAMSAGERILLAPRQVRDFVRPLIHSNEYGEIVKRGADLVFGPEWREGRLKNAYFSLPATGQRSESIILKYLLSDAATHEQKTSLLRAAHLAAGVCEALHRKDRFREALFIAETVIPLMGDSSVNEERHSIVSVKAKALRMLGRRRQAIDTLNAALADGEKFLSNKAKGTLLLNLALAHQSAGEAKEALEAAKLTQAFDQRGTANYLQAESIVISQTLVGSDLIDGLSKLENVARHNKYTTVANNIALDLAKIAGGAKATEFHDRVIRSSGDNYNRIRAVVTKAKLQINSQSPTQLSSQERALLNQAYSYLHGQRMASMFDSCHEVLWKLFRSEARWNEILRLFRHSSFLWRLYGKLVNEKRYVEELSSTDLSSLQQKGAFSSLDIRYFERRRIESSELPSG